LGSVEQEQLEQLEQARLGQAVRLAGLVLSGLDWERLGLTQPLLEVG
jgi:hypothetical protein